MDEELNLSIELDDLLNSLTHKASVLKSKHFLVRMENSLAICYGIGIDITNFNYSSKLYYLERKKDDGMIVRPTSINAYSILD